MHINQEVSIMSFHPIVEEFLAQPEVPFSKDVLAELDKPTHVQSRAVFEQVNRIISSFTPEQIETYREAAHQYLFGKKTKL